MLWILQVWKWYFYEIIFSIQLIGSLYLNEEEEETEL